MKIIMNNLNNLNNLNRSAAPFLDLAPAASKEILREFSRCWYLQSLSLVFPLTFYKPPPLSLLAMRKQNRQTHFDDRLCSCNDYLSTTILEKERDRERTHITCFEVFTKWKVSTWTMRRALNITMWSEFL